MNLQRYRLVDGKGRQIFTGEGDGRLYTKPGFRRLPVRTLIPDFELTARKLVKAREWIDKKAHWEQI
jgi:hypothetical protein